MKSQTTKAMKRKDKKIVAKPNKDFWDLGGSLFNGIVLSDDELRKARDSFEKDWADKV